MVWRKMCRPSRAAKIGVGRMRGSVFCAALAIACVWLAATASQRMNVLASTEGSHEVSDQETTFQFEAEVSRLMDIIVHSLYSNRDVFLRELISNAADALDKIRMLQLTNADARKVDETQEDLKIKITVDPERKVLEIADTGLGMTKEELVANLGAVAKSGTAAFLEQMQIGADSKNLIGQFGVGFYSAFLVADTVSVVSQSYKDSTPHVWVSGAHGSYTVAPTDQTVFGSEEPEAKLERGTRIMLSLKDDAMHYLDVEMIKSLVKKYSQFVSFPIYLYVSEKVTDSEKTQELEQDKIASGILDEGDDDEEEIIVKEEQLADDGITIVHKWVKLNEQRPIWTRNPSELSKEDYSEFYQALSGRFDEPLHYAHFSAEGEVNFKALLFIPSTNPYKQIKEGEVLEGFKLYLRRVLIKDTFQGTMFPTWLRFIVGLVDSDDLPINVSREMLQQSKLLELIRRKLVRKAMDMFRELMVEDQEARARAIEDGLDAPEEPTRYMLFYKQYSKLLKLGVLEDEGNRPRLAKLLRFRTSRTNPEQPEDVISLAEYIDRVKNEQEYIYFHAGETLEHVSSSPFVEKLLELGYEVLYLTDPMDESVLQYLGDFEGMKFMAVSKDNFKFAPADQKEQKRLIKSAKAAYAPLKDFIMNHMSEIVSKVKLSARLSTSPAVVTAVEYGYSPHFEMLTRAQMQADSGDDFITSMMPKQKVLEINPYHPLILHVLDLVLDDPESKEALTLLQSIYDTGLVQSGYYVRDSAKVGSRMNALLAQRLGVQLETPITHEDVKVRLQSDASDSRAASSDPVHDEL
ncbi:Endoplasmin-like [Porphyridium purpureum]|uniref:Endoplasmin-like n=1 Tax=Porphyridium purpureum TaxID=35688 RepID=A0A5J4Z931_PORPP|nr:Endoplasmin-like [Porphyridium purpureum]|eukprot:POR4464..scf295_1